MKLHSSYIYIRNLRCRAYHGVVPQEHVVGNDYTINLRVAYHVDKAMRCDQIAHTLNYAQICNVIKTEMETPSLLIENVAYRIGNRLFQLFPNIEKMDIDLAKCTPPMGVDCDCAGIELHLINDKTR